MSPRLAGLFERLFDDGRQLLGEKSLPSWSTTNIVGVLRNEPSIDRSVRVCRPPGVTGTSLSIDDCRDAGRVESSPEIT